MNSNYGYIVLLVVGLAGLFAILTITDSLPSGEGLSTLFSSNNLFGLAGTTLIPDDVEEQIIEAKESPGPVSDLIVYENIFAPDDSELVHLDGSDYQIALREITYDLTRWFEAHMIVNGDPHTLRIDEGVHFGEVWYLQITSIEEESVEFDIRHFQSASTCSGITGQTAFSGQNSACCEGELTELPACGSQDLSTTLRCGEWIMYCEDGELKNRHESTPIIGPPPVCAVIDCEEGYYPETTGYDDDGCEVQRCVPNDFECFGATDCPPNNICQEYQCIGVGDI